MMRKTVVFFCIAALLMLTQVYTNSGGGIPESETPQLLWKYQSNHNATIASMTVSNLDNDKMDEVVLGIQSANDRSGRIIVIDNNGGMLYNSSGSRVRDVTTGDIDNDGTNEIVIIGTVEPYSSDYVKVLEHNLTHLWTYFFNAEISEGDIISVYNFEPFVVYCLDIGNINGDDNPDVVVGTEKGLYLLSGDGTLLWNYSVDNIYTVMIHDIDSDGKNEIIYCSEHYVSAVSGNATFLWKYSINTSALRSLTIGDLDSDGSYEIIVGAGGGLYVIRNNGSLLWNYMLETDYWFSTIEVLDINNDGVDDVIAGSANIDAVLNGSANCKVYAIRNDGKLLWTYPIKGMAWSSTIGDIDGDQIHDVVIGTGAGFNFFVKDSAYIYAIKNDGSIRWEYHSPTDYTITSVAIGNLDNDSVNDIVAASISEIYAFSSEKKTVEMPTPYGYQTFLLISIGGLGLMAMFIVILRYKSRRRE